MTPQAGFGTLPLVGTLVAAWVLIALLLYWWFRPDTRVLLVLAIAGPVGIAAFVGLMTHFSQQSAAEFSLQREGEQGVATIARAEPTNVIVNRRPQVNLKLQIDLPGRGTYEQDTVALVPFGQAATPGRRLVVYVDRSDRNRILLDWANAPPPDSVGAATPSPPDSPLTTRLRELDQARTQGLISEEEYRTQRERLLSSF